MDICICGGGALGHVCAGVLGSKEGIRVSIYTGHPDLWRKDIHVTDIGNKEYRATIHAISNNAKEIIPNQDIVLLCVPGFLIESTLNAIKPYIGEAIVGAVVSSTGFFFYSHDILGKGAKVFGFQRVPFIARVQEYGVSANLLGHKKSLAVAVENISNPEYLRSLLEELFETPTSLLNNYLEAALTNSNPILHTGRLYSMFHGHEMEFFDHNILFYKEWTDEASQLLIEMDQEFFSLLDVLNVHTIPPLLDYYESTDATSLTKKIQSITAFQSITSPMKFVGNGWIVDFNSRYFTEDFPFGLRWIANLATKNNVHAPTINTVHTWGLNVLSH